MRFLRWSAARTHAPWRAALCYSRNIWRAAAASGTLKLPLKPLARRALLHGHCHQKSFGAMGAVEAALKLVPELAVEPIEFSCCGMAGSFGYGAETIDVSLKMGEALAVPGRAQGRGQRHHRGRRHLDAGSRSATAPAANALHVARVLAMSLGA